VRFTASFIMASTAPSSSSASCEWNSSNSPSRKQSRTRNVLSERRGFANKEVINVSFDHATVINMRTELEDAWMGLPAHQQAMTNRSIMAARILRAAANGERDPVRLREHALTGRNGGL
jgi:hypothetical protein